MLEFNLNESSFNKVIIEYINSSFTKTLFNIERTELSKYMNFSLNHGNDTSRINEEFSKISKCDYFILVFPYSITGVPSVIKDWLDKILFNRELNQNISRKGLVITYTTYPLESFKPNSFHRSTLKRRLHYLLYGVLKANSIQPLEPLVLYHFSNSTAIISSPNIGNISIAPDNHSEIEGLSRVLTSKFANAESLENEINTSNIKLSSFRSQSVKSKKDKQPKNTQNRDDFLKELTSSLMRIEEANEIEIIEL